MPIHAQKDSHNLGRHFLGSRCFRTSCNDVSLRKTGNQFSANLRRWTVIARSCNCPVNAVVIGQSAKIGS